MPWVGEEYRWTVPEKQADLLSGLYGEEYDDRREDLDDLVDAVRRDYAALLRAELPAPEDLFSVTATDFRSFVEKLISKLDPDIPDAG